ncbi:MAG: hypothetical protein GXY83_30785, partial [Rhodopirellula sp.]|nr:hypothetical protein [Rhodopirellula sp.]
MKIKRLDRPKLPDSYMRHIASRDCALWVGEGFDQPDEIQAVVELIQLPWRMVLCESSEAGFVQSLEAVAQRSEAQFTHARGFLHLVASNPEGVSLPPRALPVFLLNGRADAQDPSESSKRTGMAHKTRRLNMLNTLVRAKPTSLVVVANDDPRLLEQLVELWQDGFRCLLSVASKSAEDGKRIDAWLTQPESPSAIDFCPVAVTDFADDLIARTRLEIPEERVVVRMLSPDENMINLDITTCELSEQPLLDRYSIIRVNDLRLLQPEDLSQEEFSAFFDKSAETWAPYGAGLPWQRHPDLSRRVIDSLKTCLRTGYDHNRLLCIASEPGAGGTTLARSVAFLAASAGFPVLVARSLKFRPEATEIESFLLRVRQEFRAATANSESVTDEDSPETPWLIVFDVQHWDGRESELRHFLGELTRRGRSVVVLVVTGPDVSEELRNSARFERIEVLSHELNQSEALDLGRHLNRFLKPHGTEKTDSQWQQFFDAHRPNVSAQVASFWIALQFWLKGQLDISESVQSWLYKQFNQLAVTDEVRCLLLEIAALSVERQPLPEGLMPEIRGQAFPVSVILEQVRSDGPALALVRESIASQRQWAMAHDLLGRYLLTSTYFDRQMLARLSISDAVDPVHLRLMLLRRIATRHDLERT